MDIKNPNTPAEEVNNTDVKAKEESTDVTTKAATTTEPKAKTMEEILEDKKEVQTVPLATFLQLKKDKKEVEDRLQEIQNSANKGATKSEIKMELKEIADKYDINPEFLSELSTAIYAKAKEETEEALNTKLKPLEAKEKEKRIDEAFNEHFDKVIEELPEYANVVNKDVIKSLSLLPSNAKKTFQEIIEETYGKTVSGKQTMEVGTPRGGKDATLDVSKMNDPAYYKQVMANPELKKKYNEGMATRLHL